MQFLEVPGGHLHVDMRPGTGRAVVFVNALGTDFRIWDAVVEALPDVPCLRADTRGQGLSSASANLTLDMLVDDVAAQIAHFGLEGAILCGVSFGGQVALATAARRPDLIGGVVLCGTAVRFGTPDVWTERIAIVEADGIEAIADTLMDRWFPKHFQRDQALLVAGTRSMVTRCPKDGYLQLCTIVAETDLTEEARGLNLPCVVFGGQEDGSASPEMQSQLADLIPGAQSVLVPGRGHLPGIDAAQDLAACITELRADVTDKA